MNFISSSHPHEIGLPFIKLRDVSGKWNAREENDTLKNISLSAVCGQLTAIVGPVGNGKSSILSAILGEMPTYQGKIQIEGNLSFASQVPWIFSGNVRQNILFGEPYDDDRYAEVLRVCDLEKDIMKFDHGDLTLVGERGIALSRGQKARVNLARAIYRKADIYLLDDPLSAVDARVGNQLFWKCIKGFLKDKVVILITHQIHYLKEADEILVLQSGITYYHKPHSVKLFVFKYFFSGKITHHGKYDHIMKSCDDLSCFITEGIEYEEDTKSLFEEMEKDGLIKEMNESSSLNSNFWKNYGTLEEKDAPQIIEENCVTGAISESVYKGYLKAGLTKLSGIVLIISSFSLVGSLLCLDIWLSKWSNSNDVIPTNQSCSEILPGVIVFDKMKSSDLPLVDCKALKESNEFHVMIYLLLVIGLGKMISSNSH